MNDSVLEVKLTQDGCIFLNKNVIFNEQITNPKSINYNKGNGEITFNKIGQYSIKWWVATETTLKGAISFRLESSLDILTRGCTPIKTGQVSGFGTINIETIGTTLALVNRSFTDVMLSRKTGITAYLLVTPISSSSVRTYHGNLSTAGTAINVPLGNGLLYRLEHLNSTNVQLVLVPMNGETYYDYRRLSSNNGAIAFQGDYTDNQMINERTVKDTPIVNNSREMHWVLIRVQNPISKLWSMYEIRLFVSNNISRVTVWVNVVEEEVSY